MFKVIRQLFFLLTPKQRRHFYILQVLVVIMGLFELLSIASIAPFMSLVGDIGQLKEGGHFYRIYQLSGLSNSSQFLFYLGVCVLIMLTISAFISMYTIWRLSLYAASVGTEISDRLYNHYMKKDWLFHSVVSSSQLTKQVSTEALRVTDLIIQPLMFMNARGVLALFISISIFVYDPLIALSGLFILSGSYFILYKLAKKSLQSNGASMSKVLNQRFRLMSEGFGGIKDVLLLNRRHDFVKRFNESGEIFSYCRGTNTAISQVPRSFMELITFGAMIGLVLVLLKSHNGQLSETLPILAVYALAAFKLLPALQQIYTSVAQIKGNMAAFESIKTDLSDSYREDTNVVDKYPNKEEYLNIEFKENIIFRNIFFSYPNKKDLALNDLSLEIPVNGVIGLVGESGSGKSTAIDLLLGLIPPQKGELMVDGTVINEKNRRAWQNKIGFVPQSIFLSEGTIVENIAFGVPSDKIDLDKVNQVICLAHLSDLIKQLPNGMHSEVGERGVQLSGGQRQRIGIARALYNEADVLVFDEATSALDGITEKIIMEAIHDFVGKKTIVMIAHRLKTVRRCDKIYLMEKGRILDSGSYDSLVKNNPKFKIMADHS